MRTNKIIDKIDSKQLRKTPEFSPGDTVVVSVKVKEGKRERIQQFEGVVISMKNKGISSSFTVRKISYGEGVERVFQLHSTIISEIKVKEEVMLEELNYITSEIDLVNPQESKKN